MTLATLWNIPSNQELLLTFSFANADEHRKINDALRQAGHIVEDYILDPIPTFDVGAWSYQHQSSHDQFTDALGLESFDLTGVNFKDLNSLASWTQLHAESHRQAAAILGLR